MGKTKIIVMLAALLQGATVWGQSVTTIGGSVYGGGAFADTGGGTTVNLTGGIIEQDVYGGGLGQLEVKDGDDVKTPAIAAKVGGDTQVSLNENVATDSKGCVVKGNIFGCNNVNGTPLGNATVHVYATQNAAAATIAGDGAKVKGKYDVAAVYGGGNLAAYEPTDLDNSKTNVIIDGCELTSIETVYGGGNAASAPATSVTVNGTFEIDEVFGGGNGKDDITVGNETKPNPGANVGYKAYETDDEKKAARYGTGIATTNIHGGTIHRVFGGSNTKGNVRQMAMTMLEAEGGCDFLVDEAYGGGKSAYMDGKAILKLMCMPGLDAIYGGAYHADVNNDIELTITNGTFKQVFGGNNLGGIINGSITVNIEETGCRPIVIDELYGGGNNAPYSTPTGKEGPTVNIKSCTSIGTVFGGGLGANAIVTGDTHINVNQTYGKAYAANGTSFTATATTLGTIGTIYGGGNQAKVEGSTYINIGTKEKVPFASLNGEEKDVAGANITGNVYGGGNNGDVTGETHIQVGP